MISLGNETPVASFDGHTGKLVLARGNDIQAATVKARARARAPRATFVSERRRRRHR